MVIKFLLEKFLWHDYWHPYYARKAVKSLSGEWMSGIVMRRFVAGSAEYRRCTAEEMTAQAWDQANR